MAVIDKRAMVGKVSLLLTAVKMEALEEGWDLFASIEDASGWKIRRAGLRMLRDRGFEVLYRDHDSLDVVVVMADAAGSEQPVECYYQSNGWIVNL